MVVSILVEPGRRGFVRAGLHQYFTAADAGGKGQLKRLSASAVLEACHTRSDKTRPGKLLDTMVLPPEQMAARKAG